MEGTGTAQRFTRAELEAARDLPLRDVIADDLAVLFCGINPGLYSAAAGHHFARPGNRFWPALHRSGFVPHPMTAAQDGDLPAYGLGCTNVAPRTTARAAELTTAELREGARTLRDKVRTHRPRWLAVLGVTAYRTGFDSPGATIGPQKSTIGATRIWVLPNPSGLNAHFTLPELAEEFARLRVAAGLGRDDRGPDLG